MKKPLSILAGVVFTLGLIFILHAQETATPVQMDTASVAAMSDTEVLLQAVELTPPMPPQDATNGSTFYAAQHAPGSAEEWPPLPANIFNIPSWDLGGGTYLLDDRGFVWGRKKVKPRITISSNGMIPVMSAMDLNPGDASTNDDGSYFPAYTNTPIDTNGLWLQIFSVSNGTAYLSLNHATDEVYEVMSRTNLISPGWQTEAGLFPANGTVQTNALAFTVPEGDRTNALFFRAMDWTGVTHGGNTAPD